MRAQSYYRPFLSLFIRDGIMFDNILLNDEEIRFTSQTFLPSFLEISRHFGLKPLIVPLTPHENEESRLWMCYPNQDKKYVADHLNRQAPVTAVAQQ
jgi:hypothetical protein